jgi:hypothetical protein
MVDAVLIVVTVVLGLVLLGVNVYVLILYMHPDEAGFGAQLVPKLLVLLGSTLAWAQVLMLPLDVSNSLTNGGLNMRVFWWIVYMTILVAVTVLLPLAIYVYETD